MWCVPTVSEDVVKVATPLAVAPVPICREKVASFFGMLVGVERSIGDGATRRFRADPGLYSVWYGSNAAGAGEKHLKFMEIFFMKMVV
jgi:hypothetical protein